MHDKYNKMQPQPLHFPPNLLFISTDDGLLVCNDKSAQVIPTLPLKNNDNPPTDLPIIGIGKYEFKLNQMVDVYIFSFSNIKTKKTDCTIIGKDELINRLKPYHNKHDKINLKLVLSEKGLHECKDIGAEGWFMAIWLDENRDFTSFRNNWSVFN